MTENKWESLDGQTLLNELEQYSVKEGISDIHFSPEKTFVRLEIRLHGVLQKLADLTEKNYIQLVRRVKFSSKLKLNVQNIPQDGQYTFEAPGRTVNIRVATIPSRFGETMTLRLLDPKKGIVPLVDLGFPKEIHESLSSLAQLPNGLILVTGPTGSGKTTTLYALLQTIIGRERNIITLENPIEYELPGIVQSQVDEEHEYTFASGLRSILRHDPDVILVGEIRDLETAQTAVDAALTGHLVFSTLHTNSAIESIPRLLSMGVSPYTFAPSLRAILGQRLVRTLSDECKKDGSNCDPLEHSTYCGQTALPELLIITPEIRELILLNETATVIEQQAKKEGYRRMPEWGKIYIKEKVTTASEVMRVSV
ncbi:GspE/PulE family protein [Patescibacteria group bacterium]|nr:GspE/PulE family protein [Patescibacteria group bacterium]MBU1123889.1 GspE/PulE family protein [Patescibacteria group bacterium]MBU1910975.1 GspE/PulE family protein [Patescibacteria group bacterium]